LTEIFNHLETEENKLQVDKSVWRFTVYVEAIRIPSGFPKCCARVLLHLACSGSTSVILCLAVQIVFWFFVTHA